MKCFQLYVKNNKYLKLKKININKPLIIYYLKVILFLLTKIEIINAKIIPIEVCLDAKVNNSQ